MRLRTAIALAGILLWQCTGSSAAADRALGEYLAGECAACHRSDGRQQGGIPAITGLPADAFVALMDAYKTKRRENAVMQAIAGRLTADDIAALAAFYASLVPPDKTP